MPRHYAENTPTLRKVALERYLKGLPNFRKWEHWDIWPNNNGTWSVKLDTWWSPMLCDSFYDVKDFFRERFS